MLEEYDVPAIVGPDFKFAMKLQILADNANGDILMMVGDDAVFETFGWDDALRSCYKKYPDGIWAASLWDGMKKEGKTTHPHPAVGREWYEAVGYVANPIFTHFCTDPWITETAKELGRFLYFPSVRVNHYRAGLVADVELDDTFYRIRPDGQPVISAKDRTVSKMFQRYRHLDREILRSHMAGEKMNFDAIDLKVPMRVNENIEYVGEEQ